MRRAIAATGFAALLSFVVGSASVGADSSRTDLKNFQHVFVIMMENTGYDQLIGNPNAPWINQAAQTNGLATNYHGVTHPSQPNYLAATSGSTNGIAGDADINPPLAVPNIVDQVETSGRTWKAYMQAYATCSTPTQSLCPSSKVGLYARKHNPFVSYADIQNNPARMANIVDFSELDADLASGNVADYVWITPDQCHDMHGVSGQPNCGFNQQQALIATGDAFLQDTVSKIMASPAWTGNSVIFVTWDESEFPFSDTSGCCDANPGGGHVVTLVISQSNHSPVTSGAAFNHYSMLATIQDGWNLGCLGFTCDTQNVQPMAALTGPQG